MGDLSHSGATYMHSRYHGFASGIDWEGKFDGCTVMWAWRKPTDNNPYGEHVFMVEDELFGFISGLDSNKNPLALDQDGELPLYPVDYNPTPGDWWPKGFCEPIVPMQMETNRQISEVVKSANFNRGFLAFDTSSVNAADIQDASDGLVPFRGISETNKPPISYVGPTTTGRDVAAVINICMDFANKGAAYDSPLIFGEQTKRNEGGPSTSLLNANAQAPLQPVLDRKFTTLKKLYPNIWYNLREVWPQQKMVRVVGDDNVAKEQMVSKEQMPYAHEIILSPVPLVVNGRNELLNIVMAMRQMPRQDGQGPMITDEEFRLSLTQLGYAPPGLNVFSAAEQRIRWRIEQILGGKIPPAQNPHGDPQRMEDHQLAVRLVREVMLDPSFMMREQQAQMALNYELEFHMQLAMGPQPTFSIDDDVERADAQMADNALEAMENDPETMAGLVPPGVL
jgi:hypothetical protein